MSGTSKTKSLMLSLRPAGRIGGRLPDRHRRGAAGNVGFQIGVADRRQAIHRPQRDAAGDDIDGEAIVRDRRAFPRKVMNRRVDANLDALERAALDPIDDPFADLRNDQGWPHPLQRGCRHRRSRETERQARLLGIVNTAGSGDANLAVADVGLGQQHAVLFGVEAQADVDAIEDQRWFAVGSCQHDGAATETHLPIGNVVVGWLKMGQQRDPVLAGNDLEGRQQHAPPGIPFDAHFRRIDRHRIIRRIAVDDISGAGGNLAAEIGRQAVAAEFTLQFAAQQQIRAIGQVLHSQRQQDIRGRDLVGANIHRSHAVRRRLPPRRAATMHGCPLRRR